MGGSHRYSYELTIIVDIPRTVTDQRYIVKNFTPSYYDELLRPQEDQVLFLKSLGTTAI